MPTISGDLVMILSLVIGSALVILEAFMPGFGIAGISGVVLEVIAIYAAWNTHGVVFALLLTLGVLVLIGCAVFLSYRSAMKGRLSRSALILNDTQEVGGAGEHPLASLVGLKGITVTALRPGGTVEISGRRVPAASGGDFMDKGQSVSVTGTEGDHVLVQKC